MKTLIVLVFIFITLSAAQKSCESLLSGIQDTLEKTQMITRKTTIKAGFFEIMSETKLVKKTPTGLEFTLLERTGRTPPNNLSATAPKIEEGWFGPINLSHLSCEGHTLSLEGGSYKLELDTHHQESPIEGIVFEISKVNEDYFIKQMNSQIKIPNMPISATIITQISDWQLE